MIKCPRETVYKAFFDTSSCSGPTGPILQPRQLLLPPSGNSQLLGSRRPRHSRKSGRCVATRTNSPSSWPAVKSGPCSATHKTPEVLLSVPNCSLPLCLKGLFAQNSARSCPQSIFYQLVQASRPKPKPPAIIANKKASCNYSPALFLRCGLFVKPQPWQPSQ